MHVCNTSLFKKVSMFGPGTTFSQALDVLFRSSSVGIWILRCHSETPILKLFFWCRFGPNEILDFMALLRGLSHSILSMLPWSDVYIGLVILYIGYCRYDVLSATHNISFEHQHHVRDVLHEYIWCLFSLKNHNTKTISYHRSRYLHLFQLFVF